MNKRKNNTLVKFYFLIQKSLHAKKKIFYIPIRNCIYNGTQKLYNINLNVHGIVRYNGNAIYTFLIFLITLKKNIVSLTIHSKFEQFAEFCLHKNTFIWNAALKVGNHKFHLSPK